MKIFSEIRNSLFGKNKKYWLRFLAGGLIFFIVAIVFYKLIRQVEFIDNLYVAILNKFAIFLLDASKWVVSLFGYETVTYGKTIKIIDSLTTMGVYLDRGCMGRNVMLSYAGLITIFPGSWKHKLWYIPTGVIILIIVNILRISALAVIAHCCSEYSDINHHVIFKYTAWAIIFIMWIIWLNKFSPFSIKKKKKTQKVNSSS